ncbi:MAG: oligosaccharide flippase family protein [Pseudomonadota bacterium]
MGGLERTLAYALKLISGGIIGHAGLIAGAEAVNRITRIVTAVALARAMDIPEFGIAMAALTVHELVRMFIQNGLGTRIVAADDESVASVAYAICRLNWQLGLALCAIQLILAWPIAMYFAAAELGFAVAVLALVHVIYPFAMVQVYLAQRADRWGVVSLAIAVQAAVDNLATAALAIAGFGIWAVVLPKLVVAMIWVVYHRRATLWKMTRPAVKADNRQLLSYASKVLVVEMLATFRAHGDKAVVGLMLGPLALGLYAFAANIGRGITLSLSQSLSAVILPYLRRGRESGQLRRTHAETLTIMSLSVAPFAIAIAVSADWLIPIVFGEKWNGASELVAVLSLASLAHPIISATSQMLRADDRVGEDVAISAILTVAMFGTLVFTLPFGLYPAVICAAGVQLAVAIGVLAFSFRPSLGWPASVQSEARK